MITLSKDKAPQLWFVKTENVNGERKVKVLADQYVPVDTENGVYELADTSFFVQCEKEARTAFDVGTIFAVTSLSKIARDKGKSNYSAHSDKKLYALTSKDTPALYGELYNKWLADKKPPRLKPTAATPKPEPMQVKKASKLDSLLKQFPLPTIANDGFYVDPFIWNRLLIGMDMKHNLMFTGDSGSGKTEIAYMLAKKFNLPFEMFDMGSKMDPIASLIGSHRVSPSKGSYFDRARFTHAIQKKGLIILDEISRAAPLTNNILLPVLDSRKVLHLDMATSEEVQELVVNAECQFISTANIGFEYSGTHQLDRALEERFRLIKFDYPPADKEAEILIIRKNVSKKDADTIVKVANNIRAMVKVGTLPKGVSLRHTLDCAELVHGGFDIISALECSFLPYYQFHDEEIVREVITSR